MKMTSLRAFEIVSKNILGIKNKSQQIRNFYYVDLQKKKQIDRLFSKVKPDVDLHLGSKNPSYSESS